MHHASRWTSYLISQVMSVSIFLSFKTTGNSDIPRYQKSSGDSMYKIEILIQYSSILQDPISVSNAVHFVPGHTTLLKGPLQHAYQFEKDFLQMCTAIGNKSSRLRTWLFWPAFSKIRNVKNIASACSLAKPRWPLRSKKLHAKKNEGLGFPPIQVHIRHFIAYHAFAIPVITQLPRPSSNSSSSSSSSSCGR